MGAFDDWEDLHEVTVLTDRPADEYGQVVTDEHALTGMLEYGDLNVTAANGSEIVSTARLHAGLEYLDVLTVGSEVIHPQGSATIVSRAWVQIGDPDLDGVTANLA